MAGGGEPAQITLTGNADRCFRLVNYTVGMSK